MKSILCNRLVLLLFLVMTVNAHGYGQFNTNDGLASGWEGLPVKVVVDSGTLFGQSTAFALVQQAAAVWNGAFESSTLLQPPTLGSTDFDENNMALWGINDGKIRVIFDEGGVILSNAGMDPTAGLLGVGLTNYGANGKAVSGVIVINGNPSASGNSDLLGTIVHEFGHVLGLTHTPVGFGGLDAMPSSAKPTMYPFASGQDGSTLEADDIAGIREIYEP